MSFKKNNQEASENDWTEVGKPKRAPYPKPAPNTSPSSNRPSVPSSGSSFFVNRFSSNEKNTTRTNNNYNSNNNTNKKQTEDRKLVEVRKPFHQQRDRELCETIVKYLITFDNIEAYVDKMMNHPDLKHLSKTERDKAISSTLEKYMYSIIVRMRITTKARIDSYVEEHPDRRDELIQGKDYVKRIKDDYIKLIKVLVDKVASHRKHIGDYTAIKRYNEASAVMWINQDVATLEEIADLLKYIFDKLETHPFKVNCEGENLFGSLIACFKKGDIPQNVFDERYSLLLESINDAQRKMIIQAVINKLTSSLSDNSESMVQFAMLFLINPKFFLEETLEYLLGNSNNMYANMEDPSKSCYIPKFVSVLCNLFAKKSPQYLQIVEKLSLMPLFANTDQIPEDEFFKILHELIMSYCDPQSKYCLINEAEDGTNIRPKLLSLAYLVSELNHVVHIAQCKGLAENVIQAFCDNTMVHNDIRFDVCFSILKNKPFDITTVIKLLKKGEIAQSRLYTLAEYLNQFCAVFKTGAKISVKYLLECIEVNEPNVKINEPSVKINEPSVKVNSPNAKINEPITKSKKKKNRRNKKARKINCDVSLDMVDQKPVSPQRIIVEPQRINSPVIRRPKSYFSVNKFDETTEYEEVLEDMIHELQTQIMTRNRDEIFMELFTEVLDKSRSENVVKTNVVKIVEIAIQKIFDSSVNNKESIMRVVNNYAEDLEDKMEDLPCVGKNYNILKEYITNITL